MRGLCEDDLPSRSGTDKSWMPAARKKRYIEALGLSPVDATTLSNDRETGNFYEAAMKGAKDPKRVGNLVINVLATIANKKARPIHALGIPATRVTEVANLIDESKIAAASALPVRYEIRDVVGNWSKRSPATEVVVSLVAH